MGLPSINVVFKTAAEATVQRIKKGTVALILRDAQDNGGYTLASAAQIPDKLGANNRAYIQRAFLGYEDRPRKVLVYVLPTDAADFTKATQWLSTQTFDYLAGPPDLTQEEAAELGDWVKDIRENQKSIAKAVLPSYAADHEAIVNLTTTGIRVGKESYGPGEYCSRIAGLIVGTPMTMSCTYAPLPEVSDVDRLSADAADAAVDAGEFILIYDGEKVKVGMGVNSLVTLGADRGESLKKIKIVEVRDLIQANLRRACEDGWVGRYPASYDSKCLLISAVRDYLTSLEREGVLAVGTSTVGIDLDGVREHLEAKGTDVSAMTDQELKEADTGNSVFLVVSIRILDAVENIRIVVNH